MSASREQQQDLIAQAVDAWNQGQGADAALSLQLSDIEWSASLSVAAGALRDRGFGPVMTYSPKVFLPLTQLCRDVCHYCTFAQVPRQAGAAYMSVDQALEQARRGAELGCREALFTLGDKPELRYRQAAEALATMGFASTVDYLVHVARRVLRETGLLPHINAGCLDAESIAKLREVSASMGLMLESASERLCAKGMPHHGSPDKQPAARLETIRLAGEARVPFTSGILIGIGETRRERVESLLALRELHQRHGHLQEIIVQNFRAKPGTRMAAAPEPALEELQWTIAVARLIFGPSMSLQAPPNLSAGVLTQLVEAGLNDWGGVSPLTPDFVNPEAPWPHLDQLARETREAGKHLQPRLTIYPAYATEASVWLADAVRPAVLAAMDSEGYARGDDWCAGAATAPPAVAARWLRATSAAADAGLQAILDRAQAGQRLGEEEIVQLFRTRNDDVGAIVAAADALRRTVCGERISYVVTRNINYTNICGYHCRFCAFSKGKSSEGLRGRAYDLDLNEIRRRVREAWQRGATEVCLQGGIHPRYTGRTYLDILEAVKDEVPAMHVHAFSPLEVQQGAHTLGLSLEDYLRTLKSAGLGSLPGTAAEILDDEVRAHLCPDKLNTEQWLEVVETAHGVGLRTTATIMFGHIDHSRHWARHLLKVRDLQARTGGFTEFVPLPFVAAEAPMYRRGQSRRGPSFREALLMHAVARLALHPLIPNIQASWVKMGEAGLAACLSAGVNDLGGTLMNESITRAAGGAHGQEMPPERMEAIIRHAGREPWQRTTLYRPAPGDCSRASYGAPVLATLA